MRWPSNRASRERLCFLCLRLSKSSESQCFLFSLCFCGLVRAEFLPLCWWKLAEFEVFVSGLAASQSLLLFCPAGAISTATWLVLGLSIGTFCLPWEFLLHGEVLPALNAGVCVLSVTVLMQVAEECLGAWLLWFSLCDGFGFSGFLGALTSEPVPVLGWNKPCQIKSLKLIFSNPMKWNGQWHLFYRPAKIALVSVPWPPSGSARVNSS